MSFKSVAVGLVKARNSNRRPSRSRRLKKSKAPALIQVTEESSGLREEMMMMVAFITIKSSLVPLIEGLCAQIYFRFEISVVCSHLLLFFFVKEKTC